MATPGLEHEAERAKARQGFLLGLPTIVYLLIFFVAPLGFVVAYSFATRTSTGRTELRDFNLDAYARLGDDIIMTVAWRSLWMAPPGLPSSGSCALNTCRWKGEEGVSMESCA